MKTCKATKKPKELLHILRDADNFTQNQYAICGVLVRHWVRTIQIPINNVCIACREAGDN